MTIHPGFRESNIGCEQRPIKRVLDALKGSAKPSGTGWAALCPSHGDRNTSLSVSEADDGKVLLHCHAGCKTAAIVDALGLELKDLFPPAAGPPKAAKPKTAAKPTGKAYPTAKAAVEAMEGRNGKRAGLWTYNDAAGTQVMAVVRFNRPDGSKDFRPVHRAADGWRVGALPKPRPLYMLPDLAAADVVLVCEGEKATDAARSLGFTVTTSVGGSQAAGQSDWSPLAGENKTVVILPDNDDPGRKYAADVAAALARITPAPKVKVVNLPGIPAKGDVVDWIAGRPGRSNAEIGEELRQLITASADDNTEADDETEAGDDDHEPNDRPDNPHVLAAGFLASRSANPIRYYRSGFHQYDHGAYREVGEDEVRAGLTGWARAEFVRLHPADVEAWEAGGRKGPRPTVRPVTNRVVADVLNAVRSLALLPSEVEAPAWIDGATGPDPRNIIAVRNGLLDTATEKLHDPDPRFFSFTALAFGYQKDAPQPLEFERFLVSLWGDKKNPEAADSCSLSSLQEWFGYLISPDTSQQKMLWLIGPPRSGKGTIGRVLRALVGERNYCGPTLNSLTSEFGLAPLLGKGVAVISDARLGGRADAQVIVERLLSITGEDSQSVNHKHRDQLEAKLGTRFVLMSNELPRLADASGALTKRVILLRLTRTFLGKEDPALTDRLLGELPGILLWAIDGLKMLRKRGRFLQPKSGAELLGELDELSSPVGVFVRDRCVTSDPNDHAAVADLFAEWKRWCDGNGRDHPGTMQSFGRDLRAAVPALANYRPKQNGDRQRHYRGIRLRQEGDPVAEG